MNILNVVYGDALNKNLLITFDDGTSQWELNENYREFSKTVAEWVTAGNTIGPYVAPIILPGAPKLLTHIQSIVAGANIAIDNTDPMNPIISYAP